MRTDLPFAEMPITRPPPLARSPWVDVDANRIRLLRDGTSAFPAMLDAIAVARREVLLEMYWLASDRVGHQFRAALVERARAGVSVRVLFDGFGSWGTPRRFWEPLLAAGGEVREFSPLTLFRWPFEPGRAAYRDHRKLLVIDGEVGFVGGMNIVELSSPPEAPELAWRDDGIEIRGPAAAALRATFAEVWGQCGREGPRDDDSAGGADPPQDARIRVLGNRIGRRPDRVIRRTYLYGLRHAKHSVCIASAYFLPGPRFLHALRAAARRGVQVRLLVPARSDMWVVALAMNSLYGRLLDDGVQVFAYLPRILHAKTAIFDDRFTMIGSHNLDAFSWRFDLECNVVVDSTEFAESVRASFDHDLLESAPMDLSVWRERPAPLRFVAWFAALFRSFM